MINRIVETRRCAEELRSCSRRRRHRRRFHLEGLEDRVVLSTFTVQNLDDGGAGSLRQAILGANATPGADVIAFEVAGTIPLTSGPLPTIMDRVNIDGTTAPGFLGTPVVEIDASGFDGLTFGIRSSGSALRSLAIIDAGGAGVTLDGGNILVVGNYIGLRPDGTTAAGNGGDGIRINATSTRNVIGGSLEISARNVISANAGDGIAIHGSRFNKLIANFIGTDARGQSALGNAGNGIRLSRGARFNLIGGDTPLPVAPTGSGNYHGKPVDGNVISGNERNGVLMTQGAEFNRLSGNFIGTDVSGNATMIGDTELGNARDGVAIIGADNNRLLGTFPTSRPLDRSNAFLFYNVISGNGGNGLRIRDAKNTRVWTNFFGLGADNETPLGNGLDGVVVEGRSLNTVIGGIIPFGNVVSANGRHGIEIRDEAGGTSVGNSFAGTAAFNPPPEVGNQMDGIHITATGGTSLLTNIFSGNRDDGIEISGNARRVRLTKAIAGLDDVGLALQPNGDNGVEIGGNAHHNLIGGIALSIIPRSSFSGNHGHGVAIVGNAHDNVVTHSVIGTDIFGVEAFGNRRSGVFLGDHTHDNIIGGPPSSDRKNLISGNLGDGVELAGHTSRNFVIGNDLGGTRQGNARFGNQGSGLSLGAGTRENAVLDNTVIGNLGDGLYVGLSDHNRIIGNLAERNAGYGFFVEAVLANVFELNQCVSNGLGGSNQPGICHRVIAPREG